ncbi:MAG: YigZ family protein [Clostridia bacterium]|nr:YigZ family protein [Clostridia bacterium]
MDLFYLSNTDENYVSKYNEIISDLIIEKKSKFICYIFNINTESQALDYIEKVRRNYEDARHVVYVYSYFKKNVRNTRYDDDNEPGSAGTKAIIDTIEKEKIANICIVIVRYFGGILLGVGPLSRSYLNSVRQCINKCTKNILYQYIQKEFEINYSKYNSIAEQLNEYANKRLIIINTVTFNDTVYIKLYIEKNIENHISDLIK